MSKHSENEPFVPASRVPRTAEYRNSRGERIGVPPDRIPEDDEAIFERSIVQGLRDVYAGDVSGFGKFLASQGDNVAQQDFLEEDEGYNGGEIVEDYGYDRRASRVPQEVVAEQMQTLKILAMEAIESAEEAERMGNVEAARLFDGKAEGYLQRLEAMRAKLAIRGGR